jgi:hypothetical protein
MDQLKKNKMLKKVMPMFFVRVKLSRSLSRFVYKYGKGVTREILERGSKGKERKSER